MKTALLVHRIAKPSRWYHGPIQPMSREDADFWRLRQEREREKRA